MKIPSFSAEKLAQLIGVASDIALLVDKEGLVVDVSVRKNELASMSCQNWLGKPWLDSFCTQGNVDKAMTEVFKAGLYGFIHGGDLSKLD